MNEFSAEQVKAARMLLAWDQATLATAAAVGIATVKRIEASTGALQSTPRIAAKIKIALESAGIEFLGTPDVLPGVRLAKGNSSEEAIA